MTKTISIKGKMYEIRLEDKKLINIDNPKDELEISDEELDHFRQIAGGKR
jgi:hypothetical protein